MAYTILNGVLTVLSLTGPAAATDSTSTAVNPESRQGTAAQTTHTTEAPRGPETRPAAARPAPETSPAWEFEQIPPADYDKATAALLEQGATLPEGTVVSMGFTSETELVVIMLDTQGRPSKHPYTVVPSVYRWITSQPELRERQGETAAPPDRDQEGRLYFITTTALKSLYAYPSSYATLFNDYGEETTVTGLSLLTFGAAIYGSYKFSESVKLGYGRVAMMNYGGELALTYAQLMRWLVFSREDDNWNRYYDYYYDDYYYEYEYDDGPTKSELTKAWMSILGYPLGIFAGSKATYAGNHDYGRVAVMRYLGRSGILYGLVVPLLFYDDADYLFETVWSEPYYYSRSDEQRSYGLVASLMCMGMVPLGNYLGYRLTDGNACPSGRSLFIETTGVMGCVTGFLLPTIVEAETKNVYMLSGLAGHALGTVVGFNTHKERTYKFNQGAFMALSAAGGAAVALGFPIMVQAENHQAYTIAAIGGGWLGLALGENLSRKIFEKSDKDRHALNVELPILHQWPLLASAYLTQGRERTSAVSTKAEVISVRF